LKKAQDSRQTWFLEGGGGRHLAAQNGGDFFIGKKESII